MTNEEIDKRIEELDNRIQKIMQSIKDLADILVDTRVEKQRWEETRISNKKLMLNQAIINSKKIQKN